MAQLTSCKTCSQNVSIEANSCPHCGQPEPGVDMPEPKSFIEGQVVDGTVSRLMDFGAFVTIGPGKDGLVHISQISRPAPLKTSEALEVGQKVRVRVLEIDIQNRIRLSMIEV